MAVITGGVLFTMYAIARADDSTYGVSFAGPHSPADFARSGEQYFLTKLSFLTSVSLFVAALTFAFQRRLRCVHGTAN